MQQLKNRWHRLRSHFRPRTPHPDDVGPTSGRGDTWGVEFGFTGYIDGIPWNLAGALTQGRAYRLALENLERFGDDNDSVAMRIGPLATSGPCRLERIDHETTGTIADVREQVRRWRDDYRAGRGHAPTPRVPISELAEAGPEEGRETKTGWADFVESAPPGVLDLALDDYCLRRADYPKDVATWVDALRVTAYSAATVSSDSQHAYYLLTPALLREMPAPLARALVEVQLEVPKDPWPIWARTEYPVDWPELIAANPDVLLWCDEMLAANTGATGAAISEAFRLLAAHDLHPYLGVLLWVETDGRVGVEPTYLAVDGGIDLELNRRVDNILVAGGRPRDRLHDDGDLAFWQVEC